MKTHTKHRNIRASQVTRHLLQAALLQVLLFSGSWPLRAGDALDVPGRSAQVIKRLPRDRSFFTQGLLVYEGRLYHSGGTYGNSRIAWALPGSVKHRVSRQLSTKWFAEGIAVHDGELYLLTWREGIVAVYEPRELAPLRLLGIKGEGWGLTSNGESLIMSDGSSELLWRDPRDFSIQRRQQVQGNGNPLHNLNELEWVDGTILANVWQTDYLVGIDPQTGTVIFKSDLSKLLSAPERRRAGVLNGIAWDAESGKLYVTGKNWPWIFEIRLAEFDSSATLLPNPLAKHAVPNQ